MATTQLTYIGDHRERMLRAAFSFDRCKPRIKALLEAMGEAVQVQEDQFFDLLVGTDFGVATGASLDQWGALVGEQRGALDDENYRKFIRARILVNLSEGTPDQLIAIWADITEPSTVRYFPHYPAGFRLQTLRTSPLSDIMVRRIKRTMALVKPAGVAMVLTEALPDSLLFSTTGRGFGSTFSRVL